MNNQTLPRMSHVSENDLARTLRGAITEYLLNSCKLSMSPRDRSGKFMRVNKSALLCFCDMARYQQNTTQDVKDYFAYYFGIRLYDLEIVIAE